MDCKQVLLMDGWMVDGSKCLVNFMCVVLSLSFWLMPAFLLKKIVLGNFAKGPVDPKMADAIDFMVDRVSVCASVTCTVLLPQNTLLLDQLFQGRDISLC